MTGHAWLGVFHDLNIHLYSGHFHSKKPASCSVKLHFQANMMLYMQQLGQVSLITTGHEKDL